MNKPLITIITATYNIIAGKREEYFRQCIESVHNQTYKNIEHIIVDGASADGTIELIQEYVDKGWVKAHIEKDEGIYDAFNHGTMIANGDYIAFLNSDDYYTKNDGIEKAVEKLISSSADYLYSSILSVSQNQIVEANIYRAFSCIPYYHMSMVIKKEILKQNPFKLKYPIAADYDLLLNLILKNYKSTYLNYCYCAFRNGGVSDNKDVVNSEVPKLYYELYNSFCNISFFDCRYIWNTDTLPANLFFKLLSKVGTVFWLKMFIYYFKKHFRKWLFQLRTKKNHRILRFFGIEFINDEKKSKYKKILIISSKSQFKKLKQLILKFEKLHNYNLSFYHSRRIPLLGMKKYDYIISDENFKYKDKYKEKYFEANEKTLPFYLYLELNKDRLKNKNFTIVSDDCWGGFVYKGLKLAYNTPFMWTLIKNNSFLNICSDLKNINKYPMLYTRYVKDNAEPAGQINGSEVIFAHCKTFEEGLQKWNNRTKRINFDNLFFKMTSNDIEACKKFLALPYKNKILFTNLDINDKNVIKMNEPPDIYEGFWQYVHSESFKFFDLIKWLNTGEVEKINND